MSDDKRKRGRADRRRVAARQRYEVSHVARKYDVRVSLVRRVVAVVGNSRRAVEKYIRRIIRRRR